jgi:hypothetical protein
MTVAVGRLQITVALAPAPSAPPTQAQRAYEGSQVRREVAAERDHWFSVIPRGMFR